MFWIPILLLILNLGGTLAVSFGELFGFKPNPISSINEFIGAHEYDYLKQIEFVKEKLRNEPESEILMAFVALEPIASQMESRIFDCGKSSVEESLNSFAGMKLLLSRAYQNEQTKIISREESSLPLVRSFSRMESTFVDQCLTENLRDTPLKIETRHDKPLVRLNKFKSRHLYLAEKAPYSETARKIAEKGFHIPSEDLDLVANPAMLPDRKLLVFCEKSCGKIDEPLKGAIETGLELLEAARSINLELSPMDWLFFQEYLNYLLCNAVRDNLSKKLALSSKEPQ